MNLQELVSYIAKSLVDNPAQVDVKMSEKNDSISLELYVAQGDMGRVIGKSGRIANAMRALVRVAAAREGKRVMLDVITRTSD